MTIELTLVLDVENAIYTLKAPPFLQMVKTSMLLVYHAAAAPKPLTLVINFSQKMENYFVNLVAIECQQFMKHASAVTSLFTVRQSKL